MPSPTSGFGTLLQIGDGLTPTEGFTTVAQVTHITGPALAMEVIDTTNMSSSNSYREFIAGLKDAGEMTVDINYMPTEATHNATAGLIRDYDARNKRNFKIQFPDASQTTWSFAAFVTGFTPTAPINDKLTASIKLRLTGAPTLA